MAVVKTDLRNTRESARELRFEPTGAITQTNVQKAIEQVSTTPVGISSTAINFAMSPYIPLSSDSVLYVDSTGGAVVINMPLAAARGGLALTVKDVGGAASTNNITINASGAETIDSLAAVLIASDFGGYQLNPRPAVGYTVAP